MGISAGRKIQMQDAQGALDMIEFGAFLRGGNKCWVQARTHKCEENYAKNVLMALAIVDDRYGWDIEVKDGMLTIWSNLDPQMSYRMHQHQVGKGFCHLKSIASGLLERIAHHVR